MDTNAKINALIQQQLSRPKTHKVVTRYESGKVYEFEVASEAQAENYAVGQRRKIGKDLIDRDSGETVRVVSVEIVRI
jgi:hypothetical protein